MAIFFISVKDDLSHNALRGGGYNSILEIGRGSGFVNAILNELGYAVDSLDINNNLNPTYVGDISHEDFIFDKVYNVVLCAEVLEHIPFEKFDICLENISRLIDGMALITLPNCKSPYKISFSVNSRMVSFDMLRLKQKKISEGHFWEINYAKYCTNKEITRRMKKYFDVVEEGKVKQYPYHYFYLLKKKRKGTYDYLDQ